MAGTLRESGGGGSNISNNISNSSSSSSSTISSTSSSCTRLAPGPVIAVSPSHALDYDCTDCGSFLFGHRGRLRPRSHSVRNHHHSRVTSLTEAAQAHAQRLLIVGSTPPHHPFASSVPHHLVLPQSEQLSSLQQAMDMEEPCDFLNTTGIANDVSNDVSDLGSLQGSDEEEEVVGADGVMSFVACHGAEPAMLGNGGDAASTLAEIFRCFICLGKVVDAQLCPCCSKLVCQPCIKRWLTDQKSECPHCRAPLLVSQLVSCRFISEISVEVERIQGKFGDNPLEKYCPTHDSPLLYFCTTCSVAVCSDCAVLIEDHRNHTFEKLSVAYGRHKKKIRIEAAGLRRRRKELCALVASVDKNIESVLKSKDESSAELQVAFKRMQSRLEDQLKCKLLALLAQKGSMTQEMELLDTILHELDQQLNSIPKSDLIAQEPNMSRMLQDIRTRTFSDLSRTPIPADFISEVVPSYEYGELILKNYKSNLSQNRPTSFCLGDNQSPRDILLSKAVVYSEPIGVSGVAWRLKVYPNGSGASQGTHLSVFLEMVEGGNEAATYEYGIELLHRNRPNQCIVRKFSSDFEAGACWGYYQFFRIDLLEKEGYLLPEEDTITLRFCVRPLTYQQQCQDLRRALVALQAERDESATQVAVIRRAFAATFFQRRRRRSSRAGAGHTDGQASFAQAVSGVGQNHKPLNLSINTDIAFPQSHQTTTLNHCLPNIGLQMSNMTSPALSTRKSHMPSIKHFHMKMQEYSGTKVGKWLPGMWPQVERTNMNSGDQSQNSMEVPGGSPLDHATLPIDAPSGDAYTEFSMRSEDLDVLAGSSQRTTTDYNTKSTTPPVHARGKEHQELWMKKRNDFFQLPPPKSRSHKKLRSRKTHKFLPAPEAPEAPLPFTDPLRLARHLSALSIKAGPSVSTKKIVSTPTETNSVAPVEPANLMNSSNINSETREKSAHEICKFSDPENVSTCGPLPLPLPQVVMKNSEATSGADWSLENKYTTFYSSASGVGGSFCTPEIEDWGNLK